MLPHHRDELARYHRSLRRAVEARYDKLTGPHGDYMDEQGREAVAGAVEAMDRAARAAVGYHTARERVGAAYNRAQRAMDAWEAREAAMV